MKTYLIQGYLVSRGSIEEVVTDVLKNRGRGRVCDEIRSKVRYMAVGVLFIT